MAGRKFLAAAALIALNLFVLEAATRLWFAWKLGPRTLAYGTRWHRNEAAGKPYDAAKDSWGWSVQAHHNDVGSFKAYDPTSAGYSKYFPGEQKFTESPDRTEKWPVRINNHGFRGADFDAEKAPGTFRILTLGASSTFGYHDRDQETYPVLLQADLQKVAPAGLRVEVINFAIPHAMTDNVIAMLFGEGFALKPDLVTYYEGANDAAVIEPREGGERSAGFRERLASWSMLAALVNSVAPPAGAEESDVAWWWSDDLAARRSAHFNGNLRRLVEECRERGIDVVLATQQFQSTLLSPEERRGVSYADEVAMLRGKVARGELGPSDGRVGDVSVDALVFKVRATGADPIAVRDLAGLTAPRAMLVHARLMDQLRGWAAAPGSPVGFADVVHALDSRRDLMVNWVHLDGAANAIVARTLAAAIEPRMAAAVAARPALAPAGAPG
jgi:lysophospholipase L1-like esterase